MSKYSCYGPTKMPNKHTYMTLKRIVWGVLKRKVKLNVTDEAGRLPEQFIVVCNHPSAYDMFYWIAASNCVTCFTSNRYYFFNKTVGTWMRKVGCIPKNLFTVDMESVKNTLALKREGAILGFMPEVRLSMYGEFEGLPESTAKFFKKLDLPVYLCHFDGSYLLKPKWSKKRRKGIVDVKIKLLFNRQQLKDLSADDMHAEMEKALYYNDFKWLENHPDYRYKCKKQAEGLEHILYECPHCHERFSIATKKNEVFCKKCGYRVKVDDRYAFVDVNGFPHYYDNFQQWFLSLKGKLVDEIAQNPDFKLEEEVTLFLPSSNGKGYVKKSGDGVVTFDKDGLRYGGTSEGRRVEIFIPMHDTFFLSYAMGKGFQAFYGKEYYLFSPQNPDVSILWYLASEQLSLAFSRRKREEKTNLQN